MIGGWRFGCGQVHRGWWMPIGGKVRLLCRDHRSHLYAFESYASSCWNCTQTCVGTRNTRTWDRYRTRTQCDASCVPTACSCDRTYSGTWFAVWLPWRRRLSATSVLRKCSRWSCDSAPIKLRMDVTENRKHNKIQFDNLGTAVIFK